MKEIVLSRGMIVIVDDTDYEWLNQWKWTANKQSDNFYAFRNDYSCGRRKPVPILMHRLIMKAGKGEIVDHKDHDTLNNQRSNLRLATKAQNNSNRKKKAGLCSVYKGVSWKERNKKYQASINSNGKRYYLGIYKTEIEAAVAYNNKAIELHGEFALLNDVA